MAEGFPPRPSGGPPSRGRRGRGERASQPPLDAYDDNDEEMAPWAGQSIYPMGPGRREIRPPQDYDAGPGERGWQADERARPGGQHAQQQDWQDAQASPQAQDWQQAAPGGPQAPVRDWQAEERAWQAAEASRQAEELSMRAQEHARQAEEVSQHAQQPRPAGSRHGRAEERRRPDEKRRSAPLSPDQVWQDNAEEEDWVPPPERGKGRQAATRARKSRRRLMMLGAVVVVAALVVAGWLTKTWPFESKTPVTAGPPLVTTFQKGEFQTVPNACDALSPALLGQYLPGKLAKVEQSAATSTQSQCTWTLDTKPNFRVLTVSSQAYAPSLLASGDGSATFSAIDAYGIAEQSLQNPPKSSKAPKAQMGTAVGLGPNAFTGLQVFKVGNDVTDEVTAVARDRNVVITVTMQGQEHGGGFGPVPAATLRAAALAAAHQILTGLR
ncbi:MAG TPA: hypothetical protein VHY31_17115 [Streptosporangiaceae bacterium]|nr:hypothetical protein [Streptosporangiaceae bacterium]